MVPMHDPWMVLLSILISLLGAYASVSLAQRVNDARGRSWAFWLVGTAVVDGIGTWSMHYTGKAALRLPVPIEFDWRMVFLSLLVGIAGSAAALIVVSRRSKVGWIRTVIAGIFLGGIGISGVHFVGMHAMRVPSMHHYSYPIEIIAILSAILISLSSLSLTFQFRQNNSKSRMQHHASILLRGTANPVMHYTAMAGVILMAGGQTSMPPHAVGVSSLGIVAVSIAPIVVLVVGLLTSVVDRLRSHAVRLQALSSGLVEVQEVERRQLARELHDRIGQKLTALGINLDILKEQLPAAADAQLRSRLEDSAGLVESTLETIENIMADLRPPMLDDAGLLAALRWYAIDFTKRTGIEVTVGGDGFAQRLPSGAEIALFRIVQEALNNVAKHANATLVDIRLQRTGAGCVMSVTDDGIGFDPLNASNDRLRIGLGIVTMKERAQAIGGSLAVKSVPGSGTGIIIRLDC